MKIAFFDMAKVPETFDIIFEQEGDNLPVPNTGHKVTLHNGTEVFGGEVEYVSWSFSATGNIIVKIGIRALLNFSQQDIDKSDILE